MNRFVSVLAWLVVTGTGVGCARTQPERPSTPAPEGVRVISMSAEGNLESFEPIGCIPVTELQPVHTPADIYPAVTLCAQEGQVERAAELTFAARLRGFFDMERVEDPTAHQGVFILEEASYRGLSPEQIEALQAAFDRLVLSEMEAPVVCETFRAMGPPEYHPTYMIQHGIRAFTRTEGDGLVEAFEADETWQEVVDSSPCGAG